jgi:hypothetical protein
MRYLLLIISGYFVLVNPCANVSGQNEKIGEAFIRITGYFWGPESSSKDFLKPVKEEFGVGHAA